MKTFKHLEFRPHPLGNGSVMSRVEFDNGTFISVVGGCDGLYGNGKTSFEVMSTVTLRRANGVDGWLSKREITRRMKYLQSLKKV